MKLKQKLILFLTFFLLFLGSLGFEKLTVEVFGLLSSLLIASYVYLKKGEIKTPPYFNLYLIFISLLGIYTIFSPDTLNSISIFAIYLAGGAFYLAGFNLKDELKEKVPWIILMLGIVMALFYLVNTFLLDNSVVPWSLYAISSGFKNHNHIGDLWGLVLIISLFWGLKRNRFWLTLFLPGIYFLAISLSRSAYLTLGLGALVIYLESRLRKKKLPIILIGALVFLLFVYTGIFKTTLYSRPYFLQAILGFIDNPLGVGVGNFSAISSNPQYHLFGMDAFSSNVHNFLLEFMSGMGIFGLTFIAFFFLVLKRLWVQRRVVLGKALIFGLSINFLFDSTYLISAMTWLWFIMLGTVMEDSDGKK